MEPLRAIARKAIPKAARRWIRARLNRWPITRELGPLGQLHRVTPYRLQFGWGHGKCIDRHYVESFLGSCEADVRGRVLEIGDSVYTRSYGGARVVQSDVLHAVPGNPVATIVADLARADDVIPSDTFDCIILTQTLEVIYETRHVLQTLHRVLKPGGVLLATFPGIRSISRNDMNLWGEYFRFTSLSASKLICEVFSKENVVVKPYGNILTAVAFMHGLVCEELSKEELDHQDPDYELLICVRAVKAGK